MGKKIFGVFAQITFFVLLYEILTYLYFFIAEIICVFTNSFWIQFAIRYTFIPIFLILSLKYLLSIIFKRIHIVTFIFILMYIFFACIITCREAIIESGLPSVELFSMIWYFVVIAVLTFQYLYDIAYPKLKIVNEEEENEDGESEIHS